MLGYWTGLGQGPRLAWIVRISGLSIGSRGPGSTKCAHELNVIVDAITGEDLGAAAYA